jgi:hypothetical protein
VFPISAVLIIAHTGYVRKTGAASLIVLCIGTSIALGSLLMVFLAVTLTEQQAPDGYSVEFCGAK